MRLWLHNGQSIKAERVFFRPTTAEVHGQHIDIDTRFLDMEGDLYGEDSVTLSDRSYRHVTGPITCPSRQVMQDWTLSVLNPQTGYPVVQNLLIDDDPMTGVMSKSEAGTWVQAEFPSPVPVTSVMLKQMGSNYFSSV